MSVLSLIGERLPGVAGVLRGMGFMVGELTAAELATIPCDATRRGEMRRVEGAAGAADQFVICEKDAANAYAWTAVTPLDAGHDPVTVTDTASVNLTLTGQDLSAAVIAPGADTQLLFNDSAALGADAGLTYNKTTDALTVAGALSAASLNLGGATLLNVLEGNKTWDPGNVTGTAPANTTLTVTGAAVGDGVVASLSTLTTQDLQLTGTVSAADTVRVCLSNPDTVGGIDLGSGTLRAVVFKF